MVGFLFFFHCHNKFLKIKNILIYFQVKNNLKVNIYHNIEYTSKLQGRYVLFFLKDFPSYIFICFVLFIVSKFKNPYKLFFLS